MLLFSLILWSCVGIRMRGVSPIRGDLLWANTGVENSSNTALGRLEYSSIVLCWPTIIKMRKQDNFLLWGINPLCSPEMQGYRWLSQPLVWNLLKKKSKSYVSPVLSLALALRGVLYHLFLICYQFLRGGNWQFDHQYDSNWNISLLHLSSQCCS